MAWTTPRTWTDVTSAASDANTDIRDNQRALKDPPSQNYEPNEASNYSVMAGISYTNVDTDFNFSLTTGGGDVLVSFVGCVSATTGGLDRSGYFDVSVDGTRIINDNAAGLAVYPNIAGSPKKLMSFTRLITGLSAGAHTFNLQWRPVDGATTMTLYAGAGTASYDVHGQFWARELT